jgi:two-component sensor histidine kinase/putative methionine-R-sulfoxide reductase with GAF domain
VTESRPSITPRQPTIPLTELRWLSMIATRMGEVNDLESLALLCEDVLARHTDVERDGLYMRDFRDASTPMRLFYARGFTEAERVVAEATAADRHPGWVVRTGQMLWVPDTRQVDANSPSKDSPRATEMRSRLWLPVAKDGEVFGAFGFASSVPHAFTESDRELLRFVSELAGIAYSRIRAEHATGVERRERMAAMEALATSLAEKETLLKEIHHRVKNNLQIISSLLTLQIDKVPSPEARAMLQESVARVHSMALIHQQLYDIESLSRVDLASYFRSLAERIRSTLAPQASIDLDVEPTEVTVEHAVPLGLIFNELITNAFKYGVPNADSRRDAGAEPDVRVALRVVDEVLTLRVSDRGPGLPPGFDISRVRSLGMNLVRTLSRQIRGQLTIEGPGGCFTVRCPLKRT